MGQNISFSFSQGVARLQTLHVYVLNNSRDVVAQHWPISEKFCCNRFPRHFLAFAVEKGTPGSVAQGASTDYSV